MSTKITYQTLGNTLRMVTVKDVVMDIGLYDSITSPNNSVLHGTICFNAGSNQSTVVTPTGFTNSCADLRWTSGSSTANTTISSTSDAPSNSSGINNFGSITVDGTTFYGTKRCKLFYTTGQAYVATPKLKITTIKINTTSQEITTSEVELAARNMSETYRYNLQLLLNIAKTEEELLLFVGIENIFE